MGQILRVRARWTGFTGAPGFSNFYFGKDDREADITVADAIAATDRVNQFIVDIKAQLPNVVQLQVDADCEVLDEVNSSLVDVFDGAPGGAQNGTAGAGGYAAASGAVITWRTAGIRNGRRVRGRTFIVPLYSSKYGADGSLDGATVTALNTAGTGLSDSGSDLDFGVWARNNNPLVPNGIWHPCTSFSVPDMNAVLRSRRD